MSEQTIAKWHKEARPKPELKDVVVQFGCHLEEVAEMCEALKIDTLHKIISEYEDACKKTPENFAFIFRDMTEEQHSELLDSICDQVVTGTGVGVILGYDVDGALGNVNESNWSKFVDGKPVFDQNGKIAKGPNYVKPNLEPFVKQS